MAEEKQVKQPVAAIQRLPSSAQPKVILMGDSVLDNFYWLKEPQNYLRVQLEDILKRTIEPSWQCINLAVDQMTTFDFMERASHQNPWFRYERARQKTFGDDSDDRGYYASPDGLIRSVENLKHLKNVQAIVISIGGNDVYLNPTIQSNLAWSIVPGKHHLRQEEALKFGNRLTAILTAIQQAQPAALVIPVIVYHPHYDFSISGFNDAGIVSSAAKWVQNQWLASICGPMVKQFLTLARAKHLPIIDLSRTFDPKNYAHYGTEAKDQSNLVRAPWSGAEPSNTTSLFTAQLVAYIVKNWKRAHPQPSTVFYGVTDEHGRQLQEIHSEENVGDYIERYVWGKPSSTCFCSEAMTQHMRTFV